MKTVAISLWNWTVIVSVVALWTVLTSLVFVATVPFDRVRRRVGRFFRVGGAVMIWLNPLWKVSVTGYRMPPNGGHFVVVSNHQSIADIPVLSFLPWEMKWLSKASNFKMPLFGWMMRMAGDIPLHRGDRDSASGAMQRCAWYLQRRMSVMIFPEGTRSADGEIAPFKDGAFRLAIESGTPILPVVIAGSRYCIPKNTWKFGGAVDVRVHVLPPVDVKGMTLQEVGILRDRVRNDIVSMFDRLGKSLRQLPEGVGRPD